MDQIQRFIFEKKQVRGEIVRLSTSYQSIVMQHAYPLAVSNLLGNVLVVATLLSAIIKFQGRLTVQFQGKNDLKLVLAQCNNRFEIRGLVQWLKKDASEQDLLAALKEGVLAIIISPDATTTPYQGIVEWKGDSIAESVEGYFQNSEQLATRLWIAVNETNAVGLLLQLLPETQPEHENDWEHIVCLTDTLKKEEMLSLDNEALLYKLYSQEEVRLFDAEAVSFKCTCSLARSENAVLMLGEKEANEELQNKQNIVVTCEFCNKEYIFDRLDVANIFQDNNSSGQQIH